MVSGDVSPTIGLDCNASWRRPSGGPGQQGDAQGSCLPGSLTGAGPAGRKEGGMGLFPQ